MTKQYIVTLTIEKNVLVRARDEDHAKARAEAIERNDWRADNRVKAVKAVLA